MRGAKHGVRIAAIWIVVTVIVEILIGIIPIPSPVASTQAQGEHQTLYMLFYVAAPIFTFVLVLFAYELVVFRRRRGEPADVPHRPDSNPILLLWAALSFILVLFLAGWGTFTLHEITTANGPRPLHIQVIGQQWFWTFRYPSYGGMETRDLYAPVNTPIQFDVTSLDVVHSFWIYDYDIKEDAVPGVHNVAYFEATKLGNSTPSGHDWVVCNELCGLWHGHMRTQLHVITKTSFASWANTQEAFEKKIGLLKDLPPYSLVYYPTSNANWPSVPQDQSP